MVYIKTKKYNILIYNNLKIIGKKDSNFMKKL